MKTIKVWEVETKRYEGATAVSSSFCATTPRQLLDLVERWMRKMYHNYIVSITDTGKTVIVA